MDSLERHVPTLCVFPDVVGYCVSLGFWLYCRKYYLPDLVSVGYQIVTETVVSFSKLLRRVVGAVSFAARDIARLVFSFGLA